MATPGLSVWIVDDDESVRWVLEQALKQAHMFPRAFEAGEEFFDALQARPARRADHRHPHARHERARAHGAARAHGSRHSRHRDHGALGSRQRRVRLPRRRVRVSAEAVRHRRGDRARLARGAATQSRRRRADDRQADAAHHRSGAGDAGGVQGDRPAVALEHDGADHGRVGHGQGARRARAARQLAARRPRRSSR